MTTLSATSNWLGAKSKLADSEGFLGALSECGARFGESEEPGEYLKDLLVKVEWFGLINERRSEIFSGGEETTGYQASPRAVIVTALSQIEKMGTLESLWAEKLTEAYLAAKNPQGAKLSGMAAFLGGSRALTVLGVLHGAALLEGETNVAGELAAFIEEAYPEGPEAQYCRARQDLGSGRTREGITGLTQLLNKYPAYRPAVEARVDALLSLGDFTGAAEAMDEAGAQFRESIFFKLRDVRIKLSSGQNAEAASGAKTLIDALPSNAEAWGFYGQALFNLGDDAGAFGALQKSVELDPSQTYPLLLLSMLCLKHRQLEMALELSGSVAARDPSLAPSAWLVAADALTKAGGPNEALQALEEAGEAANGDPFILKEIELRRRKIEKK